jgi:hypothetical protein
LRLDFQDGISPRKEAVRALQEHGLSQVRACAIVGQPRRTLHYRGKPKDESAIAERTQTLAQERPRWGWRRLIQCKNIEAFFMCCNYCGLQKKLAVGWL